MPQRGRVETTGVYSYARHSGSLLCATQYLKTFAAKQAQSWPLTQAPISIFVFCFYVLSSVFVLFSFCFSSIFAFCLLFLFYFCGNFFYFSSIFSKRRALEGTLPEMLDAALDFVHKNTRKQTLETRR